MHKRDLNSLYSWAESLAASSSSQTPKKQKPQKDAPLNLHEEEKQPTMENEDEWNLPSDTLVALKLMHAQFPKIDKVAVRPFILRSQLYSSLRDRTTVDRELEVLKQQKVVRLFKFNTGQDDYGIMLMDDYLIQVKDAKIRIEKKQSSKAELMVFDWFIMHVLSLHLDVGITHKQLEVLLSEGGTVEDKHISLLINSGLLVRQLADLTSYWFSIPNIGLLLKSLTQGRKELLSLLSRRQYKEMLLSTLEKRRLRMSDLGIRFHIRDLIGSGHVYTVETPSGLLIRQTRD